ncbi:MAG TPA: hypothetical protein VGJ18_09980 [Gemmatimonadaceae bacterium]
MSVALVCTPIGGVLRAQSTESRRVDGVVMHGEPKGPKPIDGVRVVLHRVGPDQAGPLDSALTGPRGEYHFRYHTSGSPDAVYFVSASYDGIAYFSTPLRQPVTHGEDAQITVFDTTSGAVPIHVLGHHIILGAPDPQGQRQAVEVFELGNDSSVTRVSGGPEHPVWTERLPAGAANAKVNPNGEISPNAIAFAGGIVRLFAPISPGARQLSYAYQLPRTALPVSIPIEQATGVLEVLLEEPRATVSGGNLAEVAPTSTAGRTFRRFLAQPVPEGAVVVVDVPFSLGDSRARYFIAIAAVSCLAMVGAVIYAARRKRPALAAIDSRVHAPATDALLQAIAALDTHFEQSGNGNADVRARYDAERAELKARLAAALAEERQRG